MKSLLHADPHSVEQALTRLGLHKEPLLNAVLASHLARANCTANHPPLYPAIAAWGEAVRVLRDGLAPHGWVRFNDHNSPKTINPDGNIAIIVSTGNEGTGLSNSTPSTTSSKGPNTVTAIEVNRSLQGCLPGMEPPIFDDESDEEKSVTWILLIHHAKNEMRSELSLPLAVDADGRVSVWQERILLPALPLGGDPVVVVTPPQQPDIDVPIRRKA